MRTLLIIVLILLLPVLLLNALGAMAVLSVIWLFFAGLSTELALQAGWSPRVVILAWCVIAYFVILLVIRLIMGPTTGPEVDDGKPISLFK